MRKFRKKVKQAHQLAHVIADRCDFIVAEEIANAFFDFDADFAIAYIQVKDQVEVPQIICAFVYGAMMTDLPFEINRESHAVRVILKKQEQKEQENDKESAQKKRKGVQEDEKRQCVA